MFAEDCVAFKKEREGAPATGWGGGPSCERWLQTTRFQPPSADPVSISQADVICLVNLPFLDSLFSSLSDLVGASWDSATNIDPSQKPA